LQWDKVKNVLIAILLAVDLFLLCNFGTKMIQAHMRADRLEDDLRSLLAGYGYTLPDSFELPADESILPLMLDRNRASEEEMADKMLGGDVSRTEQEDGAVRFESNQGALEWSADGTVNGACVIDEPPSNSNQAQRRARKLIENWGLADDSTSYETSGLSVTVSGKIARQPVHNRQLVFTFSTDGTLTVSGRWSFGIPYATARENSVNCAAADALLSFASDAPNEESIESMEAGYRMEADSSKRLQLTPTWKIVTSTGEYLVDCAKKSIIASKN